MFNSLQHKNLSCLAVASIYLGVAQRRRTATSVSPATCGRGLFSRNCQIHSLSCKSCRNRARKQNKIMQNKPNLRNDKTFVTPLLTKGYVNFRLLSRPKNKAKQSQFKPNFSSKLALFFRIKPNQTQSKPIKSNFKPNLGFVFPNFGFVILRNLL